MYTPSAYPVFQLLFTTNKNLIFRHKINSLKSVNRPFQRGLGLRATFLEDGGYEGILSVMLNWLQCKIWSFAPVLWFIKDQKCLKHGKETCKFTSANRIALLRGGVLHIFELFLRNLDCVIMYAESLRVQGFRLGEVRLNN